MYLIVHDDGSVRQVGAFDGIDRGDAANNIITIIRVTEGRFEALVDVRLDSERWESVQSRPWERDDEEEDPADYADEIDQDGPSCDEEDAA